MLSKRNILAGVGVTALGATCGACSTNPTTGAVTLNPDVIDAITKITATACNAVPMVATLVEIVAAGFPAVSGAAAVTEAIAAEIARVFCGAVNAPPQAGKWKASVKGKSVEMHGYTISKDNKLVAF